MKLNPKDIKLFESLHNSRTGKLLVDYLERLNIYLCDLRRLDKVSEEKRQARLEFSNLLEKYFIDIIKVGNEKKKVKTNIYT